MLTNIRKKYNDLILRDRSLDDDTKYCIIAIILGIIHLFFAVFYYIYDIIPLCIYNIFSCGVYIYLFNHFRRTRIEKHYFRCFNLLIIEILLFASVSTILLGWSFGYMIYMFALPPVVFYMFFTSTKGNVKYPVIYIIVTCIVFISVYVYCTHGTHYYENIIPDNVARFMYSFNSVLTFAFQALFSFLMALEMNYIQKSLKSENFQLDALASLDPLTQLCNRRSMEQHLNNTMDIAKRKGSIFSVVIGDIDNFKNINDTYGHDFGDKILVNVSNIFRNQMRTGDFTCRWGGEEFLLLINADKEIATKVTERIRFEIEKSTLRNDQFDTTVSVTMTFGVMDYIPGYSVDRLIQFADEKLYKGKHNGKNQVVS